jgi:hypothetical protein
VYFHVPFHRGLPCAAGRPAFLIEAGGQVGDGPPEARRDGGDVLLVAGDQCRVCLGREVVGKVERARSKWVQVFGSNLG